MAAQIFIQMKTLSTGYPTFLESDKKEIDFLGCDGIAWLDARKCLGNLINDGIKIVDKHINKTAIIGFDVFKTYDNRYSSGKKIGSFRFKK